MSYALEITGKILPNQHRTESTNPGLAGLDKREPVNFTIPTPIPNTVADRPTTGRNGAIDGNWNKSTHLQAESSIKVHYHIRRQSHSAWFFTQWSASTIT
jgi:hypothetical protein